MSNYAPLSPLPPLPSRSPSNHPSHHDQAFRPRPSTFAPNKPYSSPRTPANLRNNNAAPISPVSPARSSSTKVLHRTFAPDKMKMFTSIYELVGSDMVQCVMKGKRGREEMEGVAMVEVVGENRSKQRVRIGFDRPFVDLRSSPCSNQLLTGTIQAIHTTHTQPNHLPPTLFTLSDPCNNPTSIVAAIECEYHPFDSPFPSNVRAGDVVRVLGMPNRKEARVVIMCFAVVRWEGGAVCSSSRLSDLTPFVASSTCRTRPEKDEAELIKWLATTALEGVTASPFDFFD